MQIAKTVQDVLACGVATTSGDMWLGCALGRFGGGGGWRGVYTSLNPWHSHPNNHELLARSATVQRRRYGLDLPRSHVSPPLPKAPLATKERKNGVPMDGQLGAHTKKPTKWVLGCASPKVSNWTIRSALKSDHKQIPPPTRQT